MPSKAFERMWPTELNAVILHRKTPHDWKEIMKRNPALGSRLDHIRLEAQPEDIKIYVSHKIDIDENSDCMNDTLRSKILERIVDTSNRM
jgi:hypothetical protein